MNEKSNEVEQALNQFLICRNDGCLYSVHYQLGQRDWAEEQCEAHERACPFR